ncbi:hypothetical protein ALT721_800083 [Alteromonas alvinellae]
MKIVFEEKDINEILTQHVKAQNMLGLADKDFSIELEIDGDSVSANLDTDVAALVGGEPTKKSAPKKRRTKAATKKEESVTEEAPAEKPAEDNVTPLSKKVEAEPEVVEPDPVEEEEEVEEDKPPFKTDEEEEALVKANSKPRKSLFV